MTKLIKCLNKNRTKKQRKKTKKYILKRDGGGHDELESKKIFPVKCLVFDQMKSLQDYHLIDYTFNAITHDKSLLEKTNLSTDQFINVDTRFPQKTSDPPLTLKEVEKLQHYQEDKIIKGTSSSKNILLSNIIPAINNLSKQPNYETQISLADIPEYKIQSIGFIFDMINYISEEGLFDFENKGSPVIRKDSLQIESSDDEDVKPKGIGRGYHQDEPLSSEGIHITFLVYLRESSSDVGDHPAGFGATIVSEKDREGEEADKRKGDDMVYVCGFTSGGMSIFPGATFHEIGPNPGLIRYAVVHRVFFKKLTKKILDKRILSMQKIPNSNEIQRLQLSKLKSFQSDFKEKKLPHPDWRKIYLLIDQFIKLKQENGYNEWKSTEPVLLNYNELVTDAKQSHKSFAKKYDPYQAENPRCLEFSHTDHSDAHKLIPFKLKFIFPSEISAINKIIEERRLAYIGLTPPFPEIDSKPIKFSLNNLPSSAVLRLDRLKAELKSYINEHFPHLANLNYNLAFSPMVQAQDELIDKDKSEEKKLIKNLGIHNNDRIYLKFSDPSLSRNQSALKTEYSLDELRKRDKELEKYNMTRFKENIDKDPLAFIKEVSTPPAHVNTPLFSPSELASYISLTTKKEECLKLHVETYQTIMDIKEYYRNIADLQKRLKRVNYDISKQKENQVLKDVSEIYKEDLQSLKIGLYEKIDKLYKISTGRQHGQFTQQPLPHSSYIKGGRGLKSRKKRKMMYKHKYKRSCRIRAIRS